MSDSITAVNSRLLSAMGEAALAEVREHAIEPDIIIGAGAAPGEPDYLRRWYVLRHRDQEGCIYLHRFGRSDTERALHDHPWPWTTILLEGAYREHTPEGTFLRERGAVVSRAATDLHRVELVTETVWTLFITGKAERDWGFSLPDGRWIDSETYLEMEE